MANDKFASQLTNNKSYTVEVMLSGTASGGAITGAGTYATPVLVDITLPAAPVVSLTDDTGTEANRTNDGALTVTANADHANIAYFVTKDSGTELATKTASQYQAYIDAQEAATDKDGSYSVRIVASDTAGNTSETTKTFTLDTNADTDNTDFSVTVATTDKLTNNAEKGTVSVALVGIDTDAATVAVTFTDTTAPTPKTVTVNAVKQNNAWTIADTDLSTLKDGTITVSALVTDTAGNTKTVTDTLTLDTVNPTLTAVALIGDDNKTATEAIVATGVLKLTAEAGSSVVVIFTNGDKEVTKTISSATGSSQIIALTSTDLTTLTDGVITVQTTVTDTVGNTTTSAEGGFTLDTIAPTLSATLPAITTTATGGNGEAGTGIGDTVILTVTFDTAVNGLTSGTANDIFTVGSTTVNATWSGSDGTSTRTLTYTIVAGINGAVTINEAKLKDALLAAGITDVAGNAFVNTGSIADITVNLPTVDTTAPTLAITNSKTSGIVKAGEAITYTFTFNEVVTDFVAGDITISNGAIKSGANLVATTSGNNAGKVYTLVIVPAADEVANTNMTVTVAANKVIDVAGNSNTAATNTQVIDVTIPIVKSASIDSGNTNLVLTLSENITGAPDNGDFVVEVLINGTWTVNTVNNIALSNDTITLTLNDVVADNREVKIAYTQNSEVSKQLKDSAGNLFNSNPSITVEVADKTAATLNIQMDDTDLTRGETATVTFTFSEALGGEVVNTVTQGSSDWTDLTTSGVANTAIITGLDALKNTSTGKLYDVSRLIKSSVLDNTWIVGGIDNGKARFFVVELHNKSGGGIEYKAFSLYKANDSLISTLATTTDFENVGWNKVNANTYTATGLKVGSFNLDDITAPNGTISNLIPS
ncbi:MAG: hypothetical protein FE834_01695, partial [Gammaproteobacteria bacterium]|nr:hypothetical protein [Gammaproteobacteria bacterium]